MEDKINKNDFKMTEHGLLPENWRFINFEDCILKERINVSKIKQRDYKKLGKYPIIDQGKNLIAGYWNTEEDMYKDKLPAIIFGDHTRIFKYIDFPFVCGADGTKVILPNDSIVDASYFYYALSNLKIESRGYNRHYHLLKEKFIPLPPLSEQKKIAAVLSAVQEAREKTEAVIAAAKVLKKSLLKYLFTYGPVPVDQAEKVKLKETEIGLVPEEWEISRLYDLVEKTYLKDPRKNPNLQFKYIDVSGIDRENLKIVEHKNLIGEKAPSRAKKIILEGDVIFATVRPTLKRIAYIFKEYNNDICSTAFCVLRAKMKVLDSKYLYFVVGREVFINTLATIQRGASYPAITDNDVKQQKIPLPTLETQKKISFILLSLMKKIESEQSKKQALDQLFKSLLHNLMTGKIRVRHLEV